MIGQHLLSDIIERTNDIVIVTRAEPLDDPGPEIVYVNEAFTLLTGYTREEVVGRSPRLLQGPGTDPAAKAQLRAALERQEPVRIEILNYAKSGQEYWLDLHIVPLRDARGRVTHFAAIERDLTERHAAEERLRESEQRFRSVISSMAEGVVVQDRSGFIIACNEAAEHILGLTREQITGRTSVDPRWSAIKPDGSPFPGEEHPAMRTLRTGRAFEGVPMGIRKPDGTLTWIAINTSLIHGNEGPEAVVSTFQDVTERQRAEELKAQFVATVSHELRTPLTSLIGALGLLQAGAVPDMPEKARELLAVAMRNGERLQALINDLLDMEKIAAGKIELQLAPLELHGLIDAALIANRPYAARHGVRFVRTDEDRGLRVYGDEHRLLQVLTNFLSNAAKFSPRGGQVEVGVERRPGERVRVTVSDAGAGVPASFRPRLFERFAQAEPANTRSHGGTGLGLAISKALIERQGGEIGHYDNHPQGSVFYFELPVLESAAPAAQHTG